MEESPLPSAEKLPQLQAASEVLRLLEDAFRAASHTGKLSKVHFDTAMQKAGDLGCGFDLDAVIKKIQEICGKDATADFEKIRKEVENETGSARVALNCFAALCNGDQHEADFLRRIREQVGHLGLSEEIFPGDKLNERALLLRLRKILSEEEFSERTRACCARVKEILQDSVE